MSEKFLHAARRWAGEGRDVDEIRVLLRAAGCTGSTLYTTIWSLKREGLVVVAPRELNARDRYVRDARAGVMHLIDLKRAGHSPRRTEFQIATDLEKPARVTRPGDLASYLGSSAAMAAEFGE